MTRACESHNNEQFVSITTLRDSSIESSEKVGIPAFFKREFIVLSVYYKWIPVFTGMTLQLPYIINLTAFLKRERSFLGSDAIKATILIPLLLGLLNLTACMVGPDYKQPETRMSEKFANASGKGLSPGEVETSYWRGFNDEKLNHLVDLAIEDNYDLRIATANLRTARALRLEAQFDLFPTVTSQTSYTRERLSEAQIQQEGVDRDIDLFSAAWH